MNYWNDALQSGEESRVLYGKPYKPEPAAVNALAKSIERGKDLVKKQAKERGKGK